MKQGTRMKSDSLSRSTLLVWTSCVIYAVGMITANYVADIGGFSIGGIFVTLFYCLIIAGMWILKFRYRLRFSVLLASILALQLAVIFRPSDQPMANLWLGGLSLVLFLISLFFPQQSSSSNRNDPVNGSDAPRSRGYR